MWTVWTASQRRAVTCIVIALLGYLAIRSWVNPIHVSIPPSSRETRFDDLRDQINPNTADAASLAALPSLGEKRAAEIVKYRAAFRRTHPHQPAFLNAGDLQSIKGIGPGIVANIEPFLIFPAQSATPHPGAK